MRNAQVRIKGQPASPGFSFTTAARMMCVCVFVVINMLLLESIKLILSSFCHNSDSSMTNCRNGKEANKREHTWSKIQHEHIHSNSDRLHQTNM